MIHYNLQCANEHQFDEWFDSSSACDFQLKRGLLFCPVCDDNHITKALMAPAVPKKGNSDKVAVEYEDVGDKFTDEVLDIHHGYKEDRNLTGIANVGEVLDLADKGVKGLKIKGLVNDDE